MTPDVALIAYRYHIHPAIVARWPANVVAVFARRVKENRA